MNKDDNFKPNEFERIPNFEAEHKIKRTKRIHRSPSKIEEEKTNNNLNHFKKQSTKKTKEETNDEVHKEEIEKELNLRKRLEIEFKKIYAKFIMERIATEENLNIYEDDSNEENNIAEQNKKENIFYYIINKTWFNIFKNYLSNRNLTYSKIKVDYPGEINNQHLILQDDSCLKLNTEKRIIINLKYACNCTCISQELWMFLINQCGGGPEIKFRPYKSNNNDLNDLDEISTIRQGVHINLIFIPKKQIISNSNNKEPSDNLINPLNPFQSHGIIKLLKNTIRKEKIYFDIRKNVNELINYINQILNQNCLVENINYRRWLLYTDANEEDISNIIQDGITKYEDADFPMNINQINNNLENVVFVPYLLNNFLNYRISEIFPNEYTTNFNNSNYYKKIKDANSMPVLNLLIEEFPYRFEEPKKNYTIKKCSECHYRDYVFVGCKCQKAFYCSDECRKRNLGNHILKCKIALLNFTTQRNANLKRVILGRKDYFEKNKNEKEKFPILGFSNLGNSCYMNSSLQCLFNIKELSNFFLYNFDKEYINKDNILGTGGLLTLGYINLLLIYNNNTNNNYITPDIFKMLLGFCSKKFEGNEQEDSHEFINYLLDMLHEDLNRVKYNPNDKNVNINYNNNKTYSDEERSIIEWNNFLKRNQSILIDMFYGQLKSCVICPNCNYRSINFNSFLSLELSINLNKNYKVINIEFIDYFRESPNINFNIILYKEENKIYFVRKKIANLFGIDLLSFELGLIHDNKIIHLFDLNDEVNEDITNIIAYRINPDYFHSEKNSRFKEINSKEIIFDENKMENNINTRKYEIIQYNDNISDDDFLSLNLLYKDNLGFDNEIFQRVIIENFLEKNKHYENIDIDEVLYLEKNKSCQEIYFQIFKKYAFNLVVQNFNSEKRNRFIELYKSDEKEKIDIKIRKLFLAFFKNIYLHPSKINLRDNFPHCPFVLFLKNEKYEINELIPINSDINYQEILKIFYDGINFQKNKYLNLSETDNNENEKENENNIISDNSSEKVNMLDDDLFDLNPFRHEGYNVSPRRQMIFGDESEKILKYKNEKDENMDRIIIVWNTEFIKKLARSTDVNLYDICEKIYEESKNKEIKLEKLLDEFSEEEKLTDDNLYQCENCREKLEAKKKIEIYHLPPILIIHLKRFNNNKKINNFIDFPLTDLDLNKYIKSEEKVPKYDLFGVINHFGSLDYGHYTALCLNYHDNNWYEYNDRLVKKIKKGKEKDKAVNKNAYILFYKSQNSEQINWSNVYKKEYEIIDANYLKKFGQNLVNISEKEDIIIDNEEIEEKSKEKNDIIIEDEKEIEINSYYGEVEDNNFSFKEGMNNKSISNISFENDFKSNEKNANPLEETPKFGNESKNNEEIKDKDINQINYVYNPFKNSYAKLSKFGDSNDTDEYKANELETIKNSESATINFDCPSPKFTVPELRSALNYTTKVYEQLNQIDESDLTEELKKLKKLVEYKKKYFKKRLQKRLNILERINKFKINKKK